MKDFSWKTAVAGAIAVAALIVLAFLVYGFLPHADTGGCSNQNARCVIPDITKKASYTGIGYEANGNVFFEPGKTISAEEIKDWAAAALNDVKIVCAEETNVCGTNKPISVDGNIIRVAKETRASVVVCGDGRGTLAVVIGDASGKIQTSEENTGKTALKECGLQ